MFSQRIEINLFYSARIKIFFNVTLFYAFLDFRKHGIRGKCFIWWGGEGFCFMADSQLSTGYSLEKIS